MIKNRITWMAAGLWVLIFLWNSDGQADSGTGEQIPAFAPGEKLTFQMKWSFMPVGEAVMEVLPMKSMNGVIAYHFSVTARSNPFVDMFYKVRDRIDAFADREMTRSVHYQQSQEEGTTRREITVNFDLKKNRAEYSDFGKRLKPIPLIPGTFDPLSVFYYARFQELETGLVMEKPVTDGKRCVIGRATVIRREKIKIKGKPFDTYLLEPRCEEIRGVFEKSPGAKVEVWVTADAYKIPIRVRSKVIVGSFIGELISASGTGSLVAK
ncbi:MAG: DUF3108 domain-containing protein [Thermodesulfobacteriota bacterium]